ncbi:MAG TPA: MFS transporter [Candidatus Acidoferrum sp.]|jgi:MFS family permease|nr:MFS transporter [Candidatus Acidoferrum sp.]
MATSDHRMTAGTAAFQFSGFRLYQIARFCIVFCTEMQSVAVGWQVYEITHRPLDLGLTGLAQFLPGVVLFLLAGHVADRFDRKNLLTLCYVGFATSSTLLLLVALKVEYLHRAGSVGPIFAILCLVGAVRSFSMPASRALLPQLVPEEQFQSAVAWNSSIFQFATILGPAMGGILYAFFRGPAAVYATALSAGTIAVLTTLRIKVQSPPRVREPFSLKTVFAGFRYIWDHKLVFGSISLDLFAVLLGGAVALLPVYAKEILVTGPWGLGLLRSAPGIGAAVMALLIAYKPIRRRAGATMLWCVAGFGVFTIVFGLSRNIVLSMISLFFVGAADMVSVVVRGVLIQIETPDEMRGRVNAVDMIFIGASNELGEFESGLAAQWFGAVPAVVLGGVGAIVVTVLWAWMFPELRRADSLSRASAADVTRRA